MNKIYVSKLDSASRQLKTAISIFIRNGDPVSVHTLGCASQEILSSLGRQQGIKSQFDQMLESIKPEYKKEVRDRINKAKNFFKHADRNQTETIEFSVESNELVLWDASCQYFLLTKHSDPLIKVFEIWISAKHPEMFILTKNQREIQDNLVKDLDIDNKKEFFDVLLPLAEDLCNKTL
jgi:hypothetical protein